MIFMTAKHKIISYSQFNYVKNTHIGHPLSLHRSSEEENVGRHWQNTKYFFVVASYIA